MMAFCYECWIALYCIRRAGHQALWVGLRAFGVGKLYGQTLEESDELIRVHTWPPGTVFTVSRMFVHKVWR